MQPQDIPEAVETRTDKQRPVTFQERIWISARRIVVFVIGSTVLLIGVVMIVAPGPAVVVIPAGLAILGTEFAWARWLLKRSKEKLKEYTSIDI